MAEQNQIISANDQSLVLSCSYDDRVKAKIIHGYKWDKKKKVWRYPLDSDTFKALTAMFPNAYIVESVKENLQNLYERYKNYSNLKTKAFHTKNHNPPDLNLPLYKHQMISYTYFRNMPYAIDFSECGAGKTATQIALIADQIRNENHHVLIICPKSIMTQVWEKDIKEFIINKNRSVKIIILNGSTDNVRKQIPSMNNPNPGIYIINFEKTWRVPELLKKYWDMIIVDESSKIKTPSAKQTKAILKLKSRYKSIMTGTPTPNSLLELFSQIKFIDPLIFGSSLYSFRDKYFQCDYSGFGWDPKQGTAEKFKKILDVISVGWKKEDCLQLPPVTTRTLECEMGGIQKKVYSSMKEEAIAFIQSQGYTASIALTKLLRLSQITSGFIQNTEGRDIEVFQKQPKMELLLETLSIIPQNRKVLIWAVFHKDIEGIKAQLGDSAVTYYGKTKNKERESNIEKFLTDPKCKYFIAHPKSAGHGLNLSIANYCIYYSTDYSYEGYQQSVDRINRLSQKNKMTVFHLVCKNTIDGVIYKALEKKKDINEFIKNVNESWGGLNEA